MNAGAAVPGSSPCRRLCTLDEARECVGCGRTLDEIVQWTRVDESRRQQIRDAARQRLAARRGPR